MTQRERDIYERYHTRYTPSATNELVWQLRRAAEARNYSEADRLHSRLVADAAEAVEDERRRLYEAVRGLPWLDVVTDEDGTGGRMVAQSAVLDLLAPPAKKEQT